MLNNSNNETRLFIMIYVLVSKIKPETKWSNYEQVEFKTVTFIGRLNLCV